MTEMEVTAFLSSIQTGVREVVANEMRGALRTQIQEVVRSEIHLHLEPIRTAIGEFNEEGTGGTGLSGHIARTAVKVDTLFDYKKIGTGMVIAVMATSAILFLGVKGWILGIFEHQAPPTDLKGD